mgnify:CR=1 FL=1
MNSEETNIVNSDVVDEKPKRRGRPPKAATVETVVEDTESTEVSEISEGEESSPKVIEDEVVNDSEITEEATVETSEAVDEPEEVVEEAEEDLSKTVYDEHPAVKFVEAKRAVSLYKSPNENTLLTAVSGTVAVVGEPVNGFVNVRVGLRGVGTFNGYIKKSDILG